MSEWTDDIARRGGADLGAIGVRAALATAPAFAAIALAATFMVVVASPIVIAAVTPYCVA